MTELLRSVRSPRVYRSLITGAVGAALFATAFLVGTTRAPAAAPIAITTPPVAMPAPVVTVVPAPPVLVLVPAPPPAPLTAPTPVEQPAPAPPRALVPTLDPACVIQSTHPAKTCEWDDGFPAISADGTLIATKFIPALGPSDLSALSIHFIDVRTSRVVRDAAILLPDESVPFMYLGDGAQTDTPDPKAEQVRTRTLARIATRVAAIQQALDGKHFRSLVPMGSHRANQDDDEAPPPPTTKVYSEIAGAAVRIVDPTSASVLWRGGFDVAGPTQRNEESECSGWGLWSIAVWWDPATRRVFATPTYRTGGCMCPDVTLERVQ